MEVEPIKQEEDVKDVKLEPALVDDEYVDIKPIVGVKQEPADGAAAAEAVAFKVVPECKEVAAGSTSVKVRGTPAGTACFALVWGCTSVKVQGCMQERCALRVYACVCVCMRVYACVWATAFIRWCCRCSS
jgi:hypothetical protein